uniref:uncharacterized protein LOC122601307 n=1 Tax=Erigeron canadensis TaxID=72917 RepID=UPI001CB8BC0D|nr:uncharacterized protein LOC122601307 [Erigeron canadensis]
MAKVKWSEINSERLRGRNFWEMYAYDNTSWGWKMILKNRSLLRNHIVYRLVDGMNTSALYDNWHIAGPLSSFISYRDAYDEDFSIKSKVFDVVVNGDWNWPMELVEKYPVLVSTPAPILSNNRRDKILWKKKSGRAVDFSVSEVFHTLSDDCDDVKWAGVVWFSQNIPRHSFILWLAIKNRLKTQDKFDWVEGNNPKCVFCNLQSDSHNHLFFECSYSKKVWREMKIVANFDGVPDSWDSIVDWCENVNWNRAISSVVQRLVLGASVYFIWLERNLRIFQGKKRNVSDLCSIIKNVVRARLIGLKILRTDKALEVAKVWNFCLNEGLNEYNSKQRWIMTEDCLMFVDETICLNVCDSSWYKYGGLRYWASFY